MKDSFVLYTQQYEAVEDLSLEQKGLLFDGLFKYVQTGDTPVFEDKEVRIAFKFIRLQIDRDGQKYDEACEKKRAAIKKRWSKGKNTDEYNSIDMNTDEYKSIHNDNDNVNVTDNDNEHKVTNVTMDAKNDNNKKTSKTKKKEESVFENENGYKAPTEEENKRFMELCGWFNQIMKETDSSINRVSILTPHRVELLRRLVVDFSDKNICYCFRKAAASSYLNGRTQDRKRPADFDWICKYDNFVKIYEGSI